MSTLPLCLINDPTNPAQHLFCFDHLCLTDQDSDIDPGKNDDHVEDNACVQGLGKDVNVDVDHKASEQEMFISDNTVNKKVHLYDGEAIAERSNDDMKVTRAVFDQLFEDTDDDSDDDAKVEHRQALLLDHPYAKSCLWSLFLDWDEADDETGIKEESSCKVDETRAECGPWRFQPESENSNDENTYAEMK